MCFFPRLTGFDGEFDAKRTIIFFGSDQGMAQVVRHIRKALRKRSENLDIQLGDEELALMAGAGDRSAFQTLLDRHYDRIFRLALRFSRHREDAEDIAQDVCLSLATKLHSFSGRSKFRTWLYSVVINRVRDLKRKALASERMHNDFGELEKLKRAEAAALDEEIEWLHETMRQLPNDLQETLVLVVGEGLAHAEAAEVLSIKEATVSWRMHELKKQLKAIAESER